MSNEVVLTNGKSLVAYACDADYRTRAITEHCAGSDTIEAMIGELVLDMRVSLRPVSMQKSHGGATAQRHRERTSAPMMITR